MFALHFTRKTSLSSRNFFTQTIRYMIQINLSLSVVELDFLSENDKQIQLLSEVNQGFFTPGFCSVKCYE